jgi:hypothetical protein
MVYEDAQLIGDFPKIARLALPTRLLVKVLKDRAVLM